MAHPRRAFGPLLYTTLAASVVLLATGYGAWPAWVGLSRSREIEGVAQNLHAPKAQVRRQAADQLTQIGDDAVPVLLKSLRDPDVEVRVLACGALSRATSRVDIVSPLLASALRDGNARVRREAAYGLGGLASSCMVADPASALQAGAMADALLSIVHDEDARVRRAASDGLGSLGAILMREQRGSDPRVAEMVSALRAALHDQDQGVRRHAADALPSLIPAARAASADLRALLNDSDWKVRHAAGSALVQIDSDSREPAIKALLDLIADPAIPLGKRLATLTARLVALGPDVPSRATPALLARLRGDAALRGVALDLLGGLGPDARPAIADIERLCDGDDTRLAARAALAIVGIKPTLDDRAQSAVLKLAKDFRVPTASRARLFEVIRERMSDREPEVVASVASGLKSADVDQRIAAVQLVESLDPRACRSLLPVLSAAQRDPDRRVATEARKVLRAIRVAATAQ
jgi:HEAT repeat protein